ncbi:MAG: hypothetical protein ABI910_21700 [Gemmatimonadota bacterium]
MIPHTPLLLVQTAHALARHAGRLSRVRVDIPCSLDFVLSIGETAQFDIRGGRSSWPIVPVRSFDELREQAKLRRWQRSRMAEGDLLLFRDWTEGGAATVGIVMALVDKRLTQGMSQRRCVIAWARPEGTHRMRVEEGIRWCSEASGDEAIRWYADASDIERAA